MAQNLGLDEALIAINKSTVSSPLEVYYQTDECFSCPLYRIKTIEDKLDNFILSTKFNAQLELRKLNTTNGLCRFDELPLKSHGQYRLDVRESSNGDLDCQFDTIDKGDCLLCPFAILICFLFIVTIIEKVHARFWTSRCRLRKQLSSKSSVESSAPDDQSNNSGGSPMQQCQQDIADEQRNSAIGTRIEALDAFRGLTITGMIFVNYGGAGYEILEHKPWDGITLADFVFPFFIFAMGASIAISVKSMIEKRKLPFQMIIWKVIRRALILAALGLCLNSKWLDYTKENLNSLRLTGVLQRFSISYLIVAIMYTVELTINKWIKAQSISHIPFLSKITTSLIEWLTALNYLTIYVFVTFFLEYDPSGHCPAGYIGPGGLTENGRFDNCTGGAAAWLDRTVLGVNHLYHDREVKHIFQTRVTHDPEGILGCTTSVLLTIVGLQCGKMFAQKRQSGHKTRLFFMMRWIIILAISCLLILLIPINKRLWSLTFILSTGLAAYITILILYLTLDIYKCERTLLLRLILSAGKNSIFLYVGHSLLSGMLPWWFPVDETSHLQLLIRLTWSTFVWLLVAKYMEMKQVFVKI